MISDRAHLNKALQSYYNDIVEAPLPSRMLVLLSILFRTEPPDLADSAQRVSRSELDLRRPGRAAGTRLARPAERVQPN